MSLTCIGGIIMLHQYYTIKETGSYEFTIQKSRFIGHVQRVNSESDAQNFIQNIKKQHHAATHNCSAYVIGENDDAQKANDDGEPSGTAGIPMLEVLKKLTLKNTAVVATRYFGGIKLGAGGLIRAYSSITSDTIQHIGMVQGDLMQGFSVTISYPLLGKTENYLRHSSYILHDIQYLEYVNMIVYAPVQQSETLQEEIVNLTNNQANIQMLDKKYIEKPI